MTKPPRHLHRFLCRAALLLVAVTGALTGCARERLAVETGDLSRLTANEVSRLDADAVEGEQREAIIETLSEVLRRRAAAPTTIDTQLAIQAAIALRDLVPAPDDAIESAAPLAESDPDRRVRYYALRLIALFPADRRVGEVAAKLLDDPDQLISGEARLIMR